MEIKKQNNVWLVLLTVFLLLAGTLVSAVPAFAAFNVDGTASIKGGDPGNGYKTWHETHDGNHSTWESPGSGFKVDPSYSNVVKPTERTTYSSLGTTCKAEDVLKAFEQDFPDKAATDLDEKSVFAFDVEENSKGKLGMWIRNIQIYDDEKQSSVQLDCKVSITDWEDQVNPKPNSHHIVLKKNPRSDINLYGIDEANVKWEYFLAGSTTPYQVKSNVTFDDIDGTQYVAFHADQVLFQFASKDSRLEYKYEDAFNLYYNPDPTNYENGDPRNAVGAVYHTNTLEFTFGTKSGGGIAHFGYLSYAMYKLTPNTPTKTVSDSDEKKVQQNTLTSANETFTYEVQQVVADGYAPSMYFQSFVMEDTLKDCLQIVSAKVQKNGAACEDFTVNVNGQKVTASAKAAAMSQAGFYGKTYTLVIQAKVKKDADLTPYLNADQSVMTVPNQATVTIDDESRTTTETQTKLILPKLEVTKAVNRYEHQVGDQVPYTITAKQTVKGATAVDVIIKDTDLPKGFQIDQKSMKVAGIEDYELELVAGGFQLKTDALAYGKTITIQFNAIPSKDVNGTIIDNTVTAESWKTEKKQAKATVYINSPKMKIQKTADRSGYAVGDTVDYTLELTQANEGCFMREVELTDLIQNDGVKLLPGSLVLFDKNNKEVTDNYDISFNGTKGFTIKTNEHFVGSSGKVPPVDKGVTAYQNLPLNTYLRVEYSAKLSSDDLAGTDLENVAVTPATENTNGEVIITDPDIPSGGDETGVVVPVKGAELKITKESDKKQYEVGETGTYTVKVEQIRPDYTAKNVVLSDQFEQEGMKIDKDSIKVQWEKTDITEDCDIEATDNGYTIKTNHDLQYNEVMTVTYEVLFEAETLNGQQVVNVAAASADNAKEKETEHTVDFGDFSAALAIEKTSDKQEYEVGDTIHYSLNVKNTVPEHAAQNVMIQDEFQQEGILLVEDSIKVLYGNQGAERDITKLCKVEAYEDSFTIKTSKNLRSDQVMTVDYDAVIVDKELAKKQVENIAFADADNTPETETPHQVEVLPLAELELEKITDKDQYAIVDDIHYTLTVTNTSEYTAKNVVIADQIKTEGVKLLPETIKVLGPDESDLTKNCKITTEENAFRIETGMNLEKAKSLTVTYTADIVDQSLAGKKIDNTAITTSENTPEEETDHQVPIQPYARLSIEKSANKKVYQIKDLIRYTLEVKSIGKTTAKNVVIEDTIQTKGVKLVKDSIRVKAQMGDITKACRIQTTERSFRIETGQNLPKGNSVLVMYQAKIMDKELAGKKVENVAFTKGDNTPPAKDKVLARTQKATGIIEVGSPSGPGISGGNGSVPQTGDEFPVWILLIAALGAAMAGIGIVVRSKKAKQKETE